MTDKRSESQFDDDGEYPVHSHARDAVETARQISRFPNLLTAQELTKQNKELGYEFPVSGSELAKYNKKK